MNVVKFFADSFLYSSPILLCTLGGLFAYRCRIVNIGLEGMMYFGGLASVLGIYLTRSPLLGILCGFLISYGVGWLFAYFSVTKKANFIITGLGINMLAAAVGRYMLAEMRITNINLIHIEVLLDQSIRLPVIDSIPILGEIVSRQTGFTYFAFLSIFLVRLLLYNTRFGVYVRMSGDNEASGRSVGIDTIKVKYAALILGAVFCGFAGYNVAVEQLTSFTPTFTAGIGFIAIAAIYCGDGKPVHCGLYALLFGAAKSLAVNLGVHFGTIAILLNMIPYLTIVLVLFVVSGTSHAKTNHRGILSV